MDGCWQPWLTGCKVDWQAWGAIATFLAVLAALWIASRERMDRQAAERAEGKLIATLLGSAFARGAPAIAQMVDDVDAHNVTGGFWIDQVAGDRAQVQELFDALSRVHLSDVERFAGRLHVLPLRVARVVTRAYGEKLTLQDHLLELARLPPNAREEVRLGLAQMIQADALATHDSFRDAFQACIEVELDGFATHPSHPRRLADAMWKSLRERRPPSKGG